MRVDKLLWFLRLTKTRGIAQALAEQGHIRLNGRRIDRAHQQILPGDVLVVPLPRGVTVVEIVMLPERRGPAPEARGCYRMLDEPGALSLAAGQRNDAAEGDLQP